jgi:MFS family permease
MHIGLYHFPGVVLAFPGGFLGKRFGDRRDVMSALVLMAIGGLITGASHSYAFSVAGRLLSGFGGMLLNLNPTLFSALFVPAADDI